MGKQKSDRGIPDVLSPPEAIPGDIPEEKTAPTVSGEDKAAAKIALERELRRYVKRTGDFRKGLSSKAKDEARRLLKRLGRTQPAWDRSILIPGFDAPTVASITYPDAKGTA